MDRMRNLLPMSLVAAFAIGNALLARADDLPADRVQASPQSRFSSARGPAATGMAGAAGSQGSPMGNAASSDTTGAISGGPGSAEGASAGAGEGGASAGGPGAGGG